MPSILPGFEYDIFISYRQKDNKYDGWVTEFVANLKKEIEATFKEDVSIYFDINPHDGLLETHQVSASLEGKLKCLIFIPIISQTYCDPKSFAWQHEFCAFNKRSKEDQFGRDIKLASGNVASRILPVKIHDLDEEDKALVESELGGVMRPIDFIYKSAGVNRPLRANEDHPQDNLNKVYYRDQINKVANAVKEIIGGLKKSAAGKADAPAGQPPMMTEPKKFKRKGMAMTAGAVLIALMGIYLFILPTYNALKDPGTSGVAVLPFRNFTGSQELDYYGVGMASEIRTKLSMSKKFSFISSLQATLSYSDTKKTPKEIGSELEVDYLLSGLYQKAGSKLKVEVELIDAATGRAVWSLPIETELADIFQLQSQIAGRVLAQFSQDAKPSEAADAPTKSLQAYVHYTRGVELAGSPTVEGSLTVAQTPAVVQFARAVQLDSGFIDAWAGLVAAEAYIYINDPDSWQKKYIQGEFAYRVLHRYDEAIALLLDVLRENPEANVHGTLSGVYRRQLKYSQALQHAKKDVDASPANTEPWQNLFSVLRYIGDDANAIKAALKKWELTRLKSDALFILNYATRSGVPLEQLPDELKQSARKGFEIEKLMAAREWKGAKKLALEEKDFENAATAFFNLGQMDSARYCAEVGLKDQPNNPGLMILAARDIQQALRFIDEFIFLDDDEAKCNEMRLAIFAYQFFGQYEKATSTLIKLNNDYPEYGNYGWVNAPFQDKIKKDYPPFQQAVNSLKRKPMPDVSTMIKW
jgi:TolB-like protein